MELAARVAGNDFITPRLSTMRRGVERGESLTRVATTTGVSTPLALEMIGVGEAAGEIDGMLGQIAEIHAEDVADDVSKFGETIEPILLGLMGVLVLVILLGVFTPLWDLGQASLHPKTRARRAPRRSRGAAGAAGRPVARAAMTGKAAGSPGVWPGRRHRRQTPLSMTPNTG